MNEMLTRLGEIRAYVNIFFGGKAPKRTTISAYLRYYAAWRGGGYSPDTLVHKSSRNWARAAVRWGTHERLRDLADRLNAAISAGDRRAAKEAVAEADECLAVLAKYPGRPRRGSDDSLAV